MSLRLYNTLTRRKAPFRPIDPSHVRLYVCGPTVYDHAHIGNARPAIVFDLLYRLLRQCYGVEAVTYVRNITDVDDKIIEGARAAGESIGTLTTRTAAVYREDMAALHCLPPDHEPLATQHIPEMVRMIAQLIEAGHAYVAEGHVLFEVATMPDYGRLSGRSLDDMRAGARVEIAGYKRDPADFVLWKPSDETQPGWDSPWGRGRPGWHIECSAMAEKLLGRHFDIHGGGLDLIFPHHENEIAQSVCAHHGEPFVEVWMHNGFLDFSGEKMSKSLGNVRSVRDLLAASPGEALRYAMLSGLYREPLDWNDERVRQAKGALDRFYGALRAAGEVEPRWPDRPAVLEALEDDLNTPLAQAKLHELATALNKAATLDERAAAKGDLLASGRLMGILEAAPEVWFRAQPQHAGELSNVEIDDLLEARRAARGRRDFAEADRIRDRLVEAGIVLEDGAGGTLWRRR